MELWDLRVTVESMEGRSVCGLRVGDYFDLTHSSHLSIPAGRHFLYLCPGRRAAAARRQAKSARGRRLAGTGVTRLLP